MGVEEKRGYRFKPYSMVIERGKIKEFAMAIGDDNPIYYEKDAARKGGFKDITVPPTFFTVIDMWAGPNFEEICQELQLDPVMVLHGEQEYEYFYNIYTGDEIKAISTVQDVTTRTGGAGGMNIILMETNYYNQNGQKVMISQSKVIERVRGQRDG